MSMSYLLVEAETRLGHHLFPSFQPLWQWYGWCIWKGMRAVVVLDNHDRPFGQYPLWF